MLVLATPRRTVGIGPWPEASRRITAAAREAALSAPARTARRSAARAGVTRMADEIPSARSSTMSDGMK